MTRVQEIVALTKRVRGEEGRWRKTFFGIEAASVRGLCCQAEKVAEIYSGYGWRSNLARGVPEQVFPGHTVGVIKTRGNAGIIVDFTSREIITGKVRDVTSVGVVRAALKKVYGVAGWRRNIRLTDKELKERYGL